MLVNNHPRENQITKFIFENNRILIFSFSLIISEFYFFDINSRVLVSFGYVVSNTVILFIFSLIFFYILLKIFKLNIFLVSENKSNFLFSLILTFVLFKLIQIPSFYGNFIGIKEVIQKILFIIFNNKFYFFTQILKIIIPFVLILFLILKYFKIQKKIIFNFIISFSFVFLFILLFQIINNFKSLKHVQQIQVLEKNNKKVIWFMFDELDPEYLKKENLNNLQLQNLNKISNESVFGEKIFSPSNATLYSMTSILTNQLITDLKIVNKEIFINNDKNKKFTFENTLFHKLNKKNFSYQIISDVIEYCSVLKITSNCKKNFFALENFFDGIKKIFLPLDYIKKIKNKINSRGKFDIKKLNSFKIHKTKKMYINKESKIDIFEFEKLLNDQTNFLFFHLYLPHTHPDNTNFNLLPSYIKDYFNMEPGNDDEEYLQNLKYLDLILGQILDKIELNKNSDILLIISSDHWRRKNSPNKAKPSFFLSKIKKDNKLITIKNSFNNIFIHDLIIKYLNDEIDNHQGIEKYINSQSVFKKSSIKWNN